MIPYGPEIIAQDPECLSERLDKAFEDFSTAAAEFHKFLEESKKNLEDLKRLPW